MPRKVYHPPKDWLASEWLLPPRGSGRTAKDIGSDFGVSRSTVLKWLKGYGIHEDQWKRQSYFRTGNGISRLPVPPKDELAALYLMPPEGEGMTLEALSSRYGVNIITMRRWIRVHDLTQSFGKRQSQHMIRKMDESFKGHRGRMYARNVLIRSGRRRECEWCGSTDKLHVHHVDHDITNGDLDNLMWLCHYCNVIEANIWALKGRGLAEMETEVVNGHKRLVVTYL